VREEFTYSLDGLGRKEALFIAIFYRTAWGEIRRKNGRVRKKV
jgi:hypothetical protein